MDNIFPICEGNKMEGKTTYTVELGYGVVVVRNVQSKVCFQCGKID
jgi:YgiT-type zinc finger domain-containing protein